VQGDKKPGDEERGESASRRSQPGDKENLHWLMLIFLGSLKDVPPEKLERLRSLGLVEDRDGGIVISSRGQLAIADFQRRLA
jgi:hypothetical protein